MRQPLPASNQHGVPAAAPHNFSQATQPGQLVQPGMGMSQHGPTSLMLPDQHCLPSSQYMIMSPVPSRPAGSPRRNSSQVRLLFMFYTFFLSLFFIFWGRAKLVFYFCARKRMSRRSSKLVSFRSRVGHCITLTKPRVVYFCECMLICFSLQAEKKRNHPHLHTVVVARRSQCILPVIKVISRFKATFLVFSPTNNNST